MALPTALVATPAERAFEVVRPLEAERVEPLRSVFRSVEPRLVLERWAEAACGDMAMTVITISARIENDRT